MPIRIHHNVTWYEAHSLSVTYVIVVNQASQEKISEGIPMADPEWERWLLLHINRYSGGQNHGCWPVGHRIKSAGQNICQPMQGLTADAIALSFVLPWHPDNGLFGAEKTGREFQGASKCGFLFYLCFILKLIATLKYQQGCAMKVNKLVYSQIDLQ